MSDPGHHIAYAVAVAQPASDGGRAEFMIVHAPGNSRTRGNALDDPQQMQIGRAIAVEENQVVFCAITRLHALGKFSREPGRNRNITLRVFCLRGPIGLRPDGPNGMLEIDVAVGQVRKFTRAQGRAEKAVQHQAFAILGCGEQGLDFFI